MVLRDLLIGPAAQVVGPVAMCALEEILVAGMREAPAVGLEADQRGEARVPIHRSEVERVLLPAHRFVKRYAPVDPNRLRPIAGETMRLGLLEQVRECL